MTMQEMMNQITAQGGQIRAAYDALAKAAMDKSVAQEELDRQQAEIRGMQARLDTLKGAYSAMQANREGALQGVQPVAAEKEKKSVREMRASNEYARAFAYALRNGISRKAGRGNEKLQILYDALTEGGGTTPGEDGGFLVPVDIDNSIRELRRELSPLADLFSQETVTAPTGWRVVDTAPTAAMPAINEMGTVSNNADQPAFGKVSYTLTKYGLRIPVSNELMNDEDANLMGYLSRWFAKKLVLTENSLLLTSLKKLTAAALTTGTVTADGAIKAILNKALDPAISVGAVILTNQTGFDALDQLTDDTGRGLLQPDPTNATLFRVFGRRVVMVSDAQLPNTEGKPEFFIGDFRAYATLFRKDGFEVASTDIGGNAWATDSTEVRGIARLAVSEFDTAAAVRRQLTL